MKIVVVAFPTVSKRFIPLLTMKKKLNEGSEAKRKNEVPRGLVQEQPNP